MEIIIDSKKNNPLLSRTEVQFTIKHSGEPTPNREIVRNELADKLNTKKENIIINNISSGFGTCETIGYAKVYTSLKQIKGVERKHFLKRNKLVSDKKKDDKKDEKDEKPTPTEEKSEESAPAEDKPEEKPAEPAKEEAPAESPKDEEKPEEPAPAEDKPKETSEPPKEETPAEPTKEEEKPEDTSSDSDDKKDANVEEEKKE